MRLHTMTVSRTGTGTVKPRLVRPSLCKTCFDWVLQNYLHFLVEVWQCCTPANLELTIFLHQRHNHRCMLWFKMLLFEN